MDHLLESVENAIEQGVKRIKTENLDYWPIGDKYMLVPRVDGIWLEEASFDFTGEKVKFICE